MIDSCVVGQLADIPSHPSEDSDLTQGEMLAPFAQQANAKVTVFFLIWGNLGQFFLFGQFCKI